MATEFDEEQKESRSNDAQAQAQERRGEGRQTRSQKDDQCCGDEDESRNHLALQFSITEYETLGE